MCGAGSNAGAFCFYHVFLRAAGEGGKASDAAFSFGGGTDGGSCDCPENGKKILSVRSCFGGTALRDGVSLCPFWQAAGPFRPDKNTGLSCRFHGGRGARCSEKLFCRRTHKKKIKSKAPVCQRPGNFILAIFACFCGRNTVQKLLQVEKFAESYYDRRNQYFQTE